MADTNASFAGAASAAGAAAPSSAVVATVASSVRRRWSFGPGRAKGAVIAIRVPLTSGVGNSKIAGARLRNHALRSGYATTRGGPDDASATLLRRGCDVVTTAGRPYGSAAPVSRVTAQARHAALRSDADDPAFAAAQRVPAPPAAAGECEAAAARLPARPRWRGRPGVQRQRRRSSARCERLGTRAPVVVFPSGGERSYFHRRASGDWGALRARRGHPAGGQAAARRPAARRDRRHLDGRLRRVLDRAAAPAALLRGRRPLARRCGAAAASRRAGAFDDAEDFARNDVDRASRAARGRGAWGGARLWLDGGTEDPFRAGGEAFASALGITMRHWDGRARGRLLAGALRQLPALLGRVLGSVSPGANYV